VGTPTTPAPFRTSFACIFYSIIHLFYWVLMFSTTIYIPPCSARPHFLANSISPLIISVLARLRRPADRRYLTISKIDFRWKVATRDEPLRRLGPFLAPGLHPPIVTPPRKPVRSRIVCCRLAATGRTIERIGCTRGKDGSPRGINPRGPIPFAVSSRSTLYGLLPSGATCGLLFTERITPIVCPRVFPLVYFSGLGFAVFHLSVTLLVL